MKALLLIDIQNDFLPGGALPVAEGDAILPVVNRLSACFSLVAATQDWHPPGHSSFASSHSGKKPFDVLRDNGREQTLWPDHCVQGSPGAGFPPALNANPVEAIFRKGTHPLLDSYSGFYDNEYRTSTGLAGYLREKGVRKIFLAGLAGDICVFATAMDGLAEGFSIYLIEDATRPLDQHRFQALLKEFTGKGGVVVQSAAVQGTVSADR
jgi:nicotinamidase/pyrazinamidase